MRDDHVIVQQQQLIARGQLQPHIAGIRKTAVLRKRNIHQLLSAAVGIRTVGRCIVDNNNFIGSIRVLPDRFDTGLQQMPSVVGWNNNAGDRHMPFLHAAS
ncbi:hypothetical protein D3C75_852460 [compost metagenome]